MARGVVTKLSTDHDGDADAEPFETNMQEKQL